MSQDTLTHLTTELLWLVLLLSLPTVVVASIVGVIVSLIQTLTQVQDQTVQFLIKLLAVCLTIMASYQWAGNTLLNYTRIIFDQIGR
ncbi:EscS/YscS/HrcS family type III secretion system export apparatus protein [Ewingella americana]|uniref:EscS/YscS/HrcS family type III secretion system export apparatus protein n=1 Tax=Ewingella americana TaxID=41202 RepID=UPI0012AE8C08|nr:EscS/YscS/HrcS family type III secretion system export apparatus protein [Ewingella americana]MRT05920.1 EscS/YscS/HrcS family type III secretion system export apparatus protein [Ewingella americana]QLK63780.1 EscS/YscS/HrcS family type III secretion system export apparatus protein [Enterobacteriaceae bacterium Kacie_13]